MGITGFLPLLKPVTKDTHVRDLKGLTVGIDTYCWLHKGVYSCSSELCQGIPTDKFIKFCVERVHLLLSHGVRPYLVFDGGYLPAKADKEVERKTKREANMQRARQLLREGNISGAHQFFSKAADVTPFMAHQLIQVVKRIPGVRYVVAPYEADAQLGFLARNGHVDAVITEDSDVLLFGCTRVLFKLERDGTGQEVNLKDVFSRRNDELDMRGMDEDDLVTVCALSGCDYLPSVPGVGLKKAYRLVKRHKQLPKILKAVKFECTGAFPSGYEDNFLRALFTFRHQRAFDPATRMTLHMTPLPESLPEALVSGDGSLGGGADPLDFLGPHIEAARASAVADGDVDPITGQPFSEMARAGANHSVGSSGKGRPSVPEEVGINGSPLEALASWRGAVTTAGRRRGAASAGITKKLSTHGNNLTKYWGAPVSKKSPSRSASSEDVDSCSTERRFEIMGATNPETPRRGSGATEAKCNSFRGHVAKEEPSSCVSPSSFYDSVGGNSLPTSDGASKSKENREPSPPVWSSETNPQAAKSKHFCGSARSGVTVVTPAPAGLRRRTLRPLRTDVASEPSGGGGRRRKALAGDANSWGAEYACPRESNNSGSLGDGGSKRRKTLGVGSLAPKEIIKGLAGVASGDWSGGLGRCVGLGRRSKSVGGTPKTSSIEARGDGSESTHDGGDDFVGNLFERFAARSPLSSSSQSNVGPSRSFHVHIPSQEESSGASASGTDPENNVLSRRAQENVGEGKVGEQEHVCGDAGVLLADKCCGDKAGADERRVEVRTSLTSRVDKIVGAGSDRFFKGQRGKNDNDYYGDRRGGGCHADCSDDGGGLHKEAIVKNGQRRDTFVPERKYIAGSAACREDLFARFVYSPPDR